jgi:hypothetical protein
VNVLLAMPCLLSENQRANGEAQERVDEASEGKSGPG